MRKQSIALQMGARWLVIGGPYTWLLLMLMIPFLYLLNVSVCQKWCKAVVICRFIVMVVGI